MVLNNPLWQLLLCHSVHVLQVMLLYYDIYCKLNTITDLRTSIVDNEKVRIDWKSNEWRLEICNLIFFSSEKWQENDLK